MSKLSKFLTTLKQIDEVVVALDEAGINVDRLIGISNAQGPVAKVIHGVISGAAGALTPNQHAAGTQALQRRLPPAKPKKKSKKAI